MGEGGDFGLGDCRGGGRSVGEEQVHLVSSGMRFVGALNEQAEELFGPLAFRLLHLLAEDNLAARVAHDLRRAGDLKALAAVGEEVGLRRAGDPLDEERAGVVRRGGRLPSGGCDEVRLLRWQELLPVGELRCGGRWLGFCADAQRRIDGRLEGTQEPPVSHSSQLTFAESSWVPAGALAASFNGTSSTASFAYS